MSVDCVSFLLKYYTLFFSNMVLYQKPYRS